MKSLNLGYLMACLALAQTEDEIGNYPCLQVISGDHTIRDNDYETKYEVADSDPTNQRIHWDWTSCGGKTMINAILMETDEDHMTSGMVEFFIDGIACPNTGGVGVSGVGGVFNCGLEGSTFEAVCTTACSPFMSVVELFIWKEKAMTLYGTPYYLADSHGCTNYYGVHPHDTDKLFNAGSYYYGNGNW